MLKLVVAMVVVMLIFAVPASGVFADGVETEELRLLFNQLEASDDAQETYELMTPREQRAVITAMENAEVTTVTLAFSYASSNSDDDEECNYHSYAVQNRVPIIRTLLWEYRTSTKWCYDGEVLTRDPVFRKSVEVPSALWEFVRHLDEDESGGEGDSEHEDYAQGHFRMCVGQTCWNNKYPSVTKRQWADGTAEAGGDW